MIIFSVTNEIEHTFLMAIELCVQIDLDILMDWHMA